MVTEQGSSLPFPHALPSPSLPSGVFLCAPVLSNLQFFCDSTDCSSPDSSVHGISKQETALYLHGLMESKGERLGQIVGPPQQWEASTESRYCVYILELLFDFISLKTTCFSLPTPNHSQSFLVSLCPLGLALAFDLFAPSHSLFFSLLFLLF